MKPGPELDALVHEKVFEMCVHEWLRDGHGDETFCKKCKGGWLFTAVHTTPKYSTDMGAAHLVVENQRRQGQYVSVSPQPEGDWIVCSTKALNPRGDGTADGFDDTMPDTTVRVLTPAHGICLVAVDYLLPSGSLDEYVVDCALCGRTRTRGHEADCPFPSLRPDLQEVFRR